MRAGKCTRPLGLPLKAPRCFDSQRQWNLYRPTAEYSAGNGFTYCTDCTPERQGVMRRAGRCAFPRTTFRKTKGGVIVGKRIEK